MAIEVKHKEGEGVSGFMYRFNKKVQHSGLVKEMRKRQFRKRAVNRGKRKQAALYRMAKGEEIARLRKYGYNNK